MADFSHLRKLRPWWIGQFHERGEAISDEEIADALEQIEPPLLSEAETRALMRILVPRRGRPPKASPSRRQLVDRLGSLDRPDVPASFVRALASRLSQDKGLTCLQLFGRDLRRLRRLQRDSLIRHLYRELKDLQSGDPIVTHPIIGLIDVPPEPSARSERALKMVQTVMRERMAMHVPSTGTMRNTVAGRKEIPADFVSFRRPNMR